MVKVTRPATFHPDRRVQVLFLIGSSYVDSCSGTIKIVLSAEGDAPGLMIHIDHEDSINIR